MDKKAVQKLYKEGAMLRRKEACAHFGKNDTVRIGRIGGTVSRITTDFYIRVRTELKTMKVDPLNLTLVSRA